VSPDPKPKPDPKPGPQPGGPGGGDGPQPSGPGREVDFVFPDTGQHIRTVMLGGEPWFVGRDVCELLELAKYRDALARLDVEQRASSVVDTLGGPQQMTVVNEDGLNDLILESRKPEARRVRRWLTREVLPSIRRTGSYGAPAKEPTRLELIDMARDAELARLEEVERGRQLEARLTIVTPKAQSWDLLVQADGDYSVGDAAKILARAGIDIGRQRLFLKLSELKWIFKSAGHWQAYQRHVDNGRLSERVTWYYNEDGDRVASDPQIRVTTKGLHDLRDMFDRGALIAFEGGAS